jgi:polysaccharide biosynthesis protein PslG
LWVAVRAWGVWWALGLMLSAEPRVTLGPPQTVVTTQPRLCVHTRLIDEVEAWKLQRSLIYVREMGASTIVEFFPWLYAEGAPRQYDWERFDRIIMHARNQGLRVIARIGLVPEWARVNPATGNAANTTFNTLPEASFDDFAAFVAAFAARYRGEVNQIIVWNEPNLAFEWGFNGVDPQSYVRLLQATYAQAHAANPDVQILAGALAPTLEPLGSPYGLNDVQFLEAMYQAGAAPYFDVLAVHTYGFRQPHDAPPSAEVLNFRRVELLRAVMQRYGDGAKAIAITEMGWNDSARWVHAVRPSQRIGYTLGAFGWMNDNWPWVDTMCVWAFRYPAPTFNYPDHFTLMTTDFQPLPLYQALQAWAFGQQDAAAPLWLPPPQAPTPTAAP